MSDERYSVLIAALSALYVTWTSYALTMRVHAFRLLFDGLGAELPVYTKLAFRVCTPFIVWPLVLATLAFLFIKEKRMQRTSTKALVSMIVAIAVAVISALVTTAMEIPMLALMKQIG